VRIFEVGSESLKTSFPATGAAYGPIESSRQQLFRLIPVEPAAIEIPGTAAKFFNPLK